jgi:hypothetical protein
MIYVGDMNTIEILLKEKDYMFKLKHNRARIIKNYLLLHRFKFKYTFNLRSINGLDFSREQAFSLFKEFIEYLHIERRFDYFWVLNIDYKDPEKALKSCSSINMICNNCDFEYIEQKRNEFFNFKGIEQHGDFILDMHFFNTDLIINNYNDDVFYDCGYFQRMNLEYFDDKDAYFLGREDSICYYELSINMLLFNYRRSYYYGINDNLNFKINLYLKKNKTYFIFDI